jgi:hypothetical protein
MQLVPCVINRGIQLKSLLFLFVIGYCDHHVENKHVKRVSSLMPPPVYFSATGKYRPVNKIMLFIITGYACAKVSISASSSLSFARPGNPEANYFCAQACTNRIFFVILGVLLSNPKNFPPP